MGQPNKFQFKINIGGVDEEIISQAPTNWLNTTIKYTRSKVYGGLFRGETSPIPFVTKAAFFLRKAYYNTGINAFVKTTLDILNSATWQYYNIFSGVLDFSTVTDTISTFTINAISDDFSVQLNANDGTTYAIPLDVPEAINLELTPIALKEQADMLFDTSPDFRAHAFFEISIANNQQNSVNNSVKGTGFLAYLGGAAPDFSDTQPNWFYVARMNTNIRLTGSIQSSVNSGHYQFNIYKTGGTLIRTLSEVINSITLQNNFSWDFAIKLNQGEKLFFYIDRLDSTDTFEGVNMQSGTMHLEYNTVSPATMCKALPAFYVVKYLLQAMNTNQDSGPNQPVPFKSDLLSGSLANLVLTSSDSIRTALGSLVYTGDTVFPGTYLVISGPINYGGSVFNTDDTFPYRPDALTFTGVGGVVELIISGFVGSVYNPGDTLQAGGTYLSSGNPGTFITYNSIVYPVGTSFIYVLGFTTFTGSDDTSFVQQTGVEPQLLINFRDTYQSILSVQGGNCAFGIENIADVNTCFIESLDYTFRATVGNLNVGIVDKDIKIQPAIDMIGNTIVCGYKDQQYSQLNGFAEVNSQQNYGTALIAPIKEINLVSIFRADPYGIEEIRVQQGDTASSRSDNDTWMIYKKDSPENITPLPDIGYFYHPLRTETLTSIVGVDSSYYNWILSPKQNLLRGGNYLASMYYGMKGYKITLTSANKNTAMVTIDNTGRRVAEADPIFISTLPAPLFIPIYCTFKPGLPSNALQMMDNLPYGFITFTYNNKQFKMFADTISVDIGENSEQEIKGLLTPNNDLTQFIH